VLFVENRLNSLIIKGARALFPGSFFMKMLKRLLINTFFWIYHHFIVSLDLYMRYVHQNADPACKLRVYRIQKHSYVRS